MLNRVDREGLYNKLTSEWRCKKVKEQGMDDEDNLRQKESGVIQAKALGWRVVHGRELQAGHHC